MKTIELVPPPAGEGISLEALEAHYAKRGIQVVWRAPQPSQVRHVSTDGHPKVECPGCHKLVVKHDVYWRRARLSMGRLGKFMPVCRKCEDHKAGYTCRECGRHRPQSSYRVTSKTSRVSRSRTCVKCEAKPADKRKRVCSKCGAKTTLAGSHKGWCKACTKAYSAARAATIERTGTCGTCGQTKPAAAFPVSPRGNRRRNCQTCVEAAREATEQECGRCHQSQPVANFSADPRATAGRKAICRKCASQVTAYKARRKRQLAKLAK